VNQTQLVWNNCVCFKSHGPQAHKWTNFSYKIWIEFNKMIFWFKFLIRKKKFRIIFMILYPYCKITNNFEIFNEKSFILVHSWLRKMYREAGQQAVGSVAFRRMSFRRMSFRRISVFGTGKPQENQFLRRFAKCRFAKCRFTECRFAECRFAECHFTE